MDKPSNRQLRALQLGIENPRFEKSFEHNQSLPLLGKKKDRNKLVSALNQLTNFSGDELGSCSYTNINKHLQETPLCNLQRSFSSIPELKSKDCPRLSLGASWSFSQAVGISKDHVGFYEQRSNRAVLTIDAVTSEILVANKYACKLFGFSSANLLDMKLTKLFKRPSSGRSDKEAFMHDFNEHQGNIVVLSGKVMEAVHQNGNLFPVSVWMRKFERLTQRSCCIVVLEPVVRIIGRFVFNSQGDIVSCDDKFAKIHGHASTSTLEGINLNELMTSYVIPEPGSRIKKSIRKQSVTSTSTDGNKFPLSVYIASQKKEEENDVLYNANVWFFTSINGMLTFNQDGLILNVNNNFSMALLGYPAKELKTKNINDLLPELITKSAEEKFSIPFQLQNDCNLKDPDNSDEKLFELGPESDPRDDGNKSNTDISSLSSYMHVPALDQINSLLLGECTSFESSQKLTDWMEDTSSNNLVASQCSSEDSWVDVTINEDISKQEMTPPVFIEESDTYKQSAMITSASSANTDGYSVISEASTNKANDSAVDWEDGKRIESGSLKIQQQSTSPCSGYQSSTASPKIEDRKILEDDKPAILTTPKKESLKKSDEEKKLTRTSQIRKLGNVTSTPMEQNHHRKKLQESENPEVIEGSHEGQARHKNGALIDVRYEIHHIDATNTYCVWINFDVRDHYFNSSSDQTLTSTFNSTLPSLNASATSSTLDVSLGTAIKQAAQRLDASSSSIFLPQEGTDEWKAIQGEFGELYDITTAIGSGAFGFVRNALRKKSNKKVVVKFIRKEKILEECWIDDYETDSRFPLEIALLARFQHPNIVRIDEFFQNDNFFSMVMPKHGVNGIDLFEFIDREPFIDESLASYIFRQIASAVYYLNKEGVVHRDIKDENIIIDEKFCCKLIDFGSAALYKRGKTFATFCGTIEYCSPEVLLGQRYEGPQLEVWALGITLYTLIYGENPFQDIEDTIEAILRPPSILTEELMCLIQGMLQPVPEHRCTIDDIVDNFWLNFPVDVTDYDWDEVVPPKNSKPALPAIRTPVQMDDKSCKKDASFTSESLNSTGEVQANLALQCQLQTWFDDKENSPLSGSGKLQTVTNNRPLGILTKKLGNISLNHSI